MLKFIFGLFIGANISFFLYACILTGARADKKIYSEEEKSE